MIGPGGSSRWHVFRLATDCCDTVQTIHNINLGPKCFLSVLHVSEAKHVFLYGNLVFLEHSGDPGIEDGMRVYLFCLCCFLYLNNINVKDEEKRI